ncbi:CueP family metal-binding protein [Gordonia alkaliphila]|uniref:CueP family metal-binding protein n=1 Tax=Gordonia alkaliphila TaxID=1053547 RepID=UPI003CD08206
MLATLVAAVALTVALVGCGSSDTDTAAPSSAPSTETFLAEHGLAGLDAQEIIDKLDATPVTERPTDLMASVRPTALVLSDGGQEVTLPLPADTFYVSFAPYVTQTHECHFHSLTTCLGELRSTPITVKAIDDRTGTVLVDRQQQTFDNGFAGLWLPKNIDATLTVSGEGRTASQAISTRGLDDATCLTTLHLVSA